ncbi:trypsin-like peptidase domain-containing protein [Candidatus Babeliales bacterium]|nr:trypsin-like peptidase domain-containing protein [Candidatus Babeliales bacterium]
MSDNETREFPTATKSIIKNSYSCDEQAIKNVFLISSKAGKGTGFLLSPSGIIITNEHVVSGCSPTEIQAISSSGEGYQFKHCILDKDRDLAALIPNVKISGGLILNVLDIKVRQEVETWGFPLYYDGPNPLVSVGHVSGFSFAKDKGVITRIIVNAAFNNGNSGGPLLRAGTNEVVGVVVAKWAPFTEFQESALEALKKTKSGLQFTATDFRGKKYRLSEAQLVADLLLQHKMLVQVMYGEAISAKELETFLEANNYDIASKIGDY